MSKFLRRFALAAAMLFGATALPAAEPKTALDQLPANTEYMVSMLRLGEQIESFGKTNLWKMIKEDKFAQEAWKQLVAKYEAGDGEWAAIKAILGDPANKDWPGLAIDLSAIDWRAARSIDQEIGLNRVTAFVEFNGSFINGFGAANKLDLSDTSLSAGLGFEF